MYRIKRGITRILDDDEYTYPSEGRYRDHEVDHYGKPIGHPYEPEFVPKYNRRLDPNHIRTDDIDKKVEDQAADVAGRAKQSINIRRQDEKQRQIEQLKDQFEHEKQSKVDRMKDDLEDQKDEKEELKQRKQSEMRNLKDEIDQKEHDKEDRKLKN